MNNKFNTFDRQNNPSGKFSFPARVERGLMSTMAQYANLARRVTGNKIDPIYSKIVRDANSLSDEYKAKQMSPDRLKRKAELSNDIANAKGIVSNISSQAANISDIATHPKEYDLGDTLGQALDPLNWLPEFKPLQLARKGKLLTKANNKRSITIPSLLQAGSEYQNSRDNYNLNNREALKNALGKVMASSVKGAGGRLINPDTGNY